MQEYAPNVKLMTLCKYKVSSHFSIPKLLKDIIKKTLYRQVVNVMLDSVTRCRCRDFAPKIEKILKIVLFRPVRDRL